MMIHPSYKEMISKINEGLDMDEAPLVTSRYSIVIAAARRARQLIAGDEPMVVNQDNEKALSTAIKELYEDKVHIVRNNGTEDAAGTLEASDQEALEGSEDVSGTEADDAEYAEAESDTEDAGEETGTADTEEI